MNFFGGIVSLGDKEKGKRRRREERKRKTQNSWMEILGGVVFFCSLALKFHPMRAVEYQEIVM